MAGSLRRAAGRQCLRLKPHLAAWDDGYLACLIIPRWGSPDL
jgi:hypothetical protein